MPVRANGQPAFGLYGREPQVPVALANGILVLTLAGSQISAVTGFPDAGALRIFGLPRDAARMNSPQPGPRRPAWLG